jgi:hypothetical protein
MQEVKRETEISLDLTDRSPESKQLLIDLTKLDSKKTDAGVIL